MRKHIFFLLTLAFSALCLAVLCACGGEDTAEELPPQPYAPLEDAVVHHTAKGVLENETLGAAIACGMTIEEIEAQPLRTIFHEHDMGVVVGGTYGMGPEDFVKVDYQDGVAWRIRVEGEKGPNRFPYTVQTETGTEERTIYDKVSNWTVDGLGCSSTREDIRAWYGTPSGESGTGMSYEYRTDGSFIDQETIWRQYQEKEGCFPESETDLLVDFGFLEGVDTVWGFEIRQVSICQ